jgi:hypothetical protein
MINIAITAPTDADNTKSPTRLSFFNIPNAFNNTDATRDDPINN